MKGRSLGSFCSGTSYVSGFIISVTSADLGFSCKIKSQWPNPSTYECYCFLHFWKYIAILKVGSLRNLWELARPPSDALADSSVHTQRSVPTVPQVHVRPTGSCRRGHLPAPVPQAVAALFGGVSHIHGPFRFLSALSFGVPSASYQPFR